MTQCIPLNVVQRKLFAKIPAGSTETGSVARYAKLNEYTGIKLYREKELRDMCYARHLTAHAGNAGPNVWHAFNHTLWGVHWYGFYIEHATLAKSMKFPDYDEGYRIVDQNLTKVFGRKCFDLSYENYGKLADGRWVAVDVSHIEDKHGSVGQIKPHWRNSSDMERNKSL
jgi:hypothetical protein